MEFHLRVDPTAKEEVLAILHKHTPLADELEELVRRYSGTDRIMGYTENGQRELRFAEIECVLVENDKTYAIAASGERFRLKARLYELEGLLSGGFLRVNRSALANRERIERFTVSFNGAVDVVFKCGYREYVSRRCFRAIRERMEIK